MSGRIACEMTLPDEELLSVSLSLELCIFPDTEPLKIRPLMDISLFGSSGSVSLSTPVIAYQPDWTLELQYEKLEHILLHPGTIPCHFILFKAYIPVGSQFFTDKGSGSAWSFRFWVESVTQHPTLENPSGIEKVERTQSFFTMSVLNTRRIMV